MYICVLCISHSVFAQVMYCSDECRDSDWDTSHEYSCFFTKCCYETGGNNKSAFDPSMLGLPSDLELGNPFNCTIQRLIGFFGFQNLKDAALQNAPVESFSDPRTKGFKNGKLNSPSLEAFLSLEDNVDKLDAAEKVYFIKVRLSKLIQSHIGL